MGKVRVFKEKALRIKDAMSECVEEIKEIYHEPAENDTNEAIENNAEEATENNAEEAIENNAEAVTENNTEAATTRVETTAAECIEEEKKQGH